MHHVTCVGFFAAILGTNMRPKLDAASECSAFSERESGITIRRITQRSRHDMYDDENAAAHRCAVERTTTFPLVP